MIGVLHDHSWAFIQRHLQCTKVINCDKICLGGTPETFQGIQHMEKILFKNKMEESSKQTKITDAFSVNQLILRE